MTVELVLLCAYSLVLLGIAHALRALGRRSTSPWASRTLAGHLRATGQQAEPLTDDDWPHSEVPRLYEGIGLVAALAAAALSVGSLALHHAGPAVALPLSVLALSVISAWRMTPAAGKRRAIRRRRSKSGHGLA
jgi:hypothetical protein